MVDAKSSVGDIASRLGLDHHQTAELLQLFVERSLADLGQLRSAIAGADLLKATNAAHSVKGAALALGLSDLADAALELELQTKTGDRLDRLYPRIRELEGRVRRLAELLPGEADPGHEGD